ncbi:hypothetical protein [Microtetraspora glauca]|uniref:Tail terminator n=1 Tax=Microtetraspora glauca TaxID=1996 RepID=A0ABV3GAA2_MICGL
MTRAAVRDGIAKYFGGPYVPEFRCYRPGPLLAYGLATVRPYLAKRVPDQDYTIGLPPGRGMGTYAVVHLEAANERREAWGGATSGWKHITHAVTLQLFHLSTQPLAEDAQADLDALLEAIGDLIHADRTLGEAVLQAGESTNGIRYWLSQPTYDQGSEHVRTLATVSFDADVYIQA